MYDLAVHYGAGFVPLAEISARQDVSLAYLEQLAATLRKAGLIRSARGAQGGYVLARHPRDITIGEIFRAVEGPIALSACITRDLSEDAARGSGGPAAATASSAAAIAGNSAAKAGSPGPTGGSSAGGGCERIEGCALRLVWQRLGTCMTRALNSITLEDLKREGAGRAAASGPCEVCKP